MRSAFFISWFLVVGAYAADPSCCTPVQSGGTQIETANITSSLITDNPLCLTRKTDETNQQAITRANLSDEEVLARLVFAESVSTNFASKPECAAQKSQIFESIAWGVMNRVRLAEKSAAAKTSYGSGISGVIFKKSQFNPAVSKTSVYSKYFLCPSSQGDNYKELWKLAKEKALKAMTDPSKNPFLLTDWEKSNQTSLVAHFYYPLSTQATVTPPSWANTKAKAFIADVTIDGKKLNTSCIWFFRHDVPFK